MSEAGITPVVRAPASAAAPRREQLILGVIGTLAFLLVWEVAARFDLINPVVVSNPSRIAAAFVAQLRSGEILGDLAVSLIEFAAGFGLSLVVGIGLGRALHGVVLGEMFSSNAGLGYRITFYAAHLRTADVFVPLVILVVIGLLINQLGNAVEARLQAWRA
jgi:ABC-type nitrate/sulfonate/bicarbonate transport system permease component